MAEQLCVRALREKVEALQDTPRLSKQVELGTEWIEVGLCTPDEAEAAEAFTQAEAQFERVTTQANAWSDMGIRAYRWLQYVPVFRMRRDKAPARDIAAVAFRALGQSTGRLFSLLPDLKPDGELDRKHIGILGENSVAALLARAGYGPFPSSCREGATQDPELNSDFHLLENGKVPLEVKFKKLGDHPGYDTNRILVIKYAEICRKIGEYNFNGHERPSINKIAITIARGLVHEASGGRSTRFGNNLLQQGSELVIGELVSWLEERRG
ncbi:MAG TPA: hypothetical protein VJ836_03780 [Candidatus Saccharimonadales bacterium]|nr:hypothetical protein [Candidatus Saccharimonadales bacterium]